MNENCKLILGDCLEKLKEIPDNSIDLVLTDPPYGLEFMGKSWDKWEDNFNYKWASACFPKLKAGAFLVFTMTPRQDLLWRCLAGIEKAGYELQTTGMYWLYHTGFPKALDISKSIDKRNSRTEEQYKELGEFLLKRRKELNIPQKEIAKHFPSKTGGLTGCVSNWELGENVPTKKQWDILKKELKIQINKFDELIERIEAEREVVGKSEQTIGIGGASPRMGGKHFITEPINETSKKWQGWKSFQLKPSVECVVVAQKPREQKTITGQVLDNGCGAVNIEECRIPYANKDDMELRENTFRKPNIIDGKVFGGGKYSQPVEQGRFPANIIVQGNPLKGQSKSGTLNCKAGGFGGSEICYGKNSIKPNNSYQANSGSTNRFYSLDAWAEKRNITLTEDSAFFDVPKPSKSEKNKGCEELPFGEPPKTARSKPAEGRKNALGEPRQNNHPTCKPVTLFRYLTTLFCQPNGTILDPFMGSGTTGIAVLQENKKFIGIEKEAEYFKIAKARIKEAQKQTNLRWCEQTKEAEKYD